VFWICRQQPFASKLLITIRRRRECVSARHSAMRRPFRCRCVQPSLAHYNVHISRAACSRKLSADSIAQHALCFSSSPAHDIFGTARIVCGAGSMKRRGVRPSVRPFVCPIMDPRPQQQVRCVRFVAVGPSGRRCRSPAAAAACDGRMRAVLRRQRT